MRSQAKLAKSEGAGIEGISPGLVDRTAADVIGEPLDLSAELISRVFDPVRFVEVRTLPGDPAPQEVKRILEERRVTHARAAALYRERSQGVRERHRGPDAAATEWTKRALSRPENGAELG